MTGIKSRIIKALLFLDRYSPYPSRYKLKMSEAEIKTFVHFIAKSQFYLEFGAGGSTFKVLQKSKANVYSVESSLDWINYMRSYLYIRISETRRLIFHPVDIGPTRGWGYSDGSTSKHLFPNYSSTIFDHLDSKKIDTVFIDGRFRVASTLSTILHCFPNNELTILIHDFWKREHYHVVLNYLFEVDRTDSLGVFKIKKDIDLKLVEHDYDIYKYIEA